MVRRLEQVAALIVAAGLAIVSYWLFFSWAGVEGTPEPGERRQQQSGASSGRLAYRPPRALFTQRLVSMSSSPSRCRRTFSGVTGKPKSSPIAQI